MQIRSVMTSHCLQLRSGEILQRNDISGNIEKVFLKLAPQMASQRDKLTPLELLP